MYTFIVHLFDVDYDLNRLVILTDRKAFADFILNVNERYVIKKIEVIDAEFQDNYREFCLPKSI